MEGVDFLFFYFDSIFISFLSRSYLKDLKPGNIQYSYEVLPLHLGVQGLIDASHHPLEHAVVNGLGQSADGVHTLVLVLT